MYPIRSPGLAALLVLIPMMIPSDLSPQEALQASDRWNRAALEWIGLLTGGAFDEAGARVDPAVPAGALGPAQLRTIWSQVSDQLGTLRGLEPGVVREEGEYHLVDLSATFENQSLVLRVVLSDSLLVSGFFLRQPEPPPYDPPAYVRADSFTEVEVTVGAEPWLLPGTLTLPKEEGPLPAVVLVHGSGPNDRDETIGANRPFRDLAWGLASRGVVVLRYDKRTRAHGSRIPPDIGLDDEVVEDALAAIGLIRNRPEVDAERVFLVGHSLGGMLAPEIGRRDGALAGIAILAAPARPFFQVLTGQLEYLAGLEPDPASQARAQLDSILATVRKVASGEAEEGRAVLGAPPAYWRELAAVQPVEVAEGLRARLLVLQGGRDYQSTREDFSVWVEALGGREGFEGRLYPGLNHLFAPGEGMATPEEYMTGAGHVSEEVIIDLARWISATGMAQGLPRE